MSFQFDDDAFRKLQEQIEKQLQEQVNESMRTAVKRVRDGYTDEDEATLVERLKDEIRRGVGNDIAPGLNFDDDELLKLAREIRAGELTD